MNRYLIKLADHLDKKGFHKEADYVDWIIKNAEEDSFRSRREQEEERLFDRRCLANAKEMKRQIESAVADVEYVANEFYHDGRLNVYEIPDTYNHNALDGRFARAGRGVYLCATHPYLTGKKHFEEISVPPGEVQEGEVDRDMLRRYIARVSQVVHRFNKLLDKQAERAGMIEFSELKVQKPEIYSF